MTGFERLDTVRPGLIAVSGPDAERFLNGQVTQDVRSLGKRSLPACVTDAKGRLQHHVTITAGPETGSFLIVCRPDEAETLLARLDRYLIADDVRLEIHTGRWDLVHANACIGKPVMARERAGVLSPGFDLWWPAGSVPDLPAPLGPAEAEERRVASGIPVWGAELAEGLLPPEAGLDRDAISYRKGCYIGQEVLSRIKSAGKVNRRLTAFDLSGSAAPGESITCDGEPVGEITSVSPSGRHAIGYLGRKSMDGSDFTVANRPGSRLLKKKTA
jgi:folate-binding protein YgfZ